jgi:hypothetical protein
MPLPYTQLERLLDRLTKANVAEFRLTEIDRLILVEILRDIAGDFA